MGPPRGAWPWLLVLGVAALGVGLVANVAILVHIAYLLGLLGLLAPLYAWLTLRAIRLDHRVAATRVAVGDRLLEVYEARNEAPWPVLACGIVARPGIAQVRQSWGLALRGRGHEEWTSVSPAVARGKYAVGLARFWVSDPFGLVSYRRTLTDMTEVVVHPRPRIVPGFSLAAARAGDLVPARRSWARMPVSGAVRPFALGDASTRIHWLSSARHGFLMVKDSDHSVGQRVWVALDLSNPMHAGRGEESTVEYGVEAAAYVVELAFKAGLDVGLIVTGRQIYIAEPARGRDQREYLFDLLAVAQEGTGPSLAATIDDCRAARPSDALVMITPLALPDMLDLCARLRRLGCGVAVVCLDGASFGGPNTPDIEGLAAERVAVFMLGRGEP